MAHVSNYVQKLGLNIYNNENQPSVPKKNYNLILGTHVLAHTNWK